MRKLLYIGLVFLSLTSCKKEAIILVDGSYSVSDTLKISAFEDSKSFVIYNEGNVPINYSATVSNNYISLATSSDKIPVGQQKNVIVNVNRAEMVTGTYFSKIFLTIKDTIYPINVRINHFQEEKSILLTDVVDAEYSKSKDILVYVSSSPAAVHIFNSVAGTTKQITLNYSPTCVSVSLDGESAVIGHDQHLTYVNLTSAEIIRTYDVSCDAIDIVLGNNEWAYVFPRQNQWTNIRCVDLSLPNNNEVLNTGGSIYAGTKGKLHPSGKFIYGADSGLSPSDIEKYDIQNGRAVLLYDSPYHGQYEMSGDLWFSEDGVRVFTRGQTVLKLSESQSQDMLYNGKIALDDPYTIIHWLDHSQNKENLYIILAGVTYYDPNHKPFVYVYNSTNLVYKSKYELEKFLVPDNNGGGTFYEVEPYFAFANSTGNELYVLTKAIGSGLVNEWAIEKINIQ